MARPNRKQRACCYPFDNSTPGSVAGRKRFQKLILRQFVGTGPIISDPTA
ncbi:MAG: hypothetical protein AB8G99_13060 [Planctomycetaceae bacterium]